MTCLPLVERSLLMCESWGLQRKPLTSCNKLWTFSLPGNFWRYYNAFVGLFFLAHYLSRWCKYSRTHTQSEQDVDSPSMKQNTVVSLPKWLSLLKIFMRWFSYLAFWHLAQASVYMAWELFLFLHYCRLMSIENFGSRLPCSLFELWTNIWQVTSIEAIPSTIVQHYLECT